MSPNNSHVQHVVTSVIVAHDGAAWIPRVTEALLNQSRQVQRVVAVDTGSRDRSGAMLAESLGRGAVFGMDRGTGYAAAVTQALRHRAANTHLQPAAGMPKPVQRGSGTPLQAAKDPDDYGWDDNSEETFSTVKPRMEMEDEA